jgi:hypothetical protein
MFDLTPLSVSAMIGGLLVITAIFVFFIRRELK